MWLCFRDRSCSFLQVKFICLLHAALRSFIYNTIFKLYELRRPLISEEGLFINSNVYQHVCMYSIFIMSGLIDVLGIIATIPEDSEKVRNINDFV